MAHQRSPDVWTPALAPVLAGRWSPRAFDADHELSALELRTILEAARWAPSWGNSQPWAFLVAPRGSAQHERLVETLSRGNLAWAPRASALLCAAHQTAASEHEEIGATEWTAYDLGQAVAHLTVQVHAMGLHAHQMAGFDRDRARAAFSIPSHWRPLTLIAIGLRAEPSVLDERTREKELRPRSRRPLRAFGTAWGEPLDLGDGRSG